MNARVRSSWKVSRHIAEPRSGRDQTDIGDADAPIEARSAEDEATIRLQAQRLVTEKTYRPSHYMIDKCLAELRAILAGERDV